MPARILAPLVVFASMLAAAATAQTPAVADYVDNPDFYSAKLAPDGAHIAVVASRGDTEVLQILDTETLELKASFETQKDMGVLDFWWANEERIVFATSIIVPASEVRAFTGNLHALNVDNTQKYLLVGPSSGDDEAFFLLDTLENDREHVVVAGWAIRGGSIVRSHPNAYVMDIYQMPRRGTNTRLDNNRLRRVGGSPLGWGELVADNDGEVRLAYAANDAGNLDVSVKQGDDWMDVASFLGVEKDGVNTELGIPLGFNGANTGIYHLARSPQGTIGVALFDIASGTSNLLYAHERYDVTVDDLIRSADGEEIIGVTVMGALPETHYFSEHADIAFYRSLDRGLPGYQVRFLNFTDDERKGLAMVSSSTVPPGLFLLDRDKGQFTPLFSSMAKLQGSPMTAAEPVSLSARDGTPIEGYLTPAVGVDGAAPLVVLVHGGPHGVRDNPVFNPEVKLLAARGYSVLQVNYRGSGGYGLEFRERGYRNWGQAMIDDIVDATRHVVEQGKAAPDRMCVMGGSYGAYAAMMALARYPDMWECGIGIAGVYDLTYMRRSDIPFLPGGEAFLEAVIGSDTADLEANSPVKLASAIRAPVLLAHGGDDRRAPPEHAERLRDAFDDAGVKYDWLYVRNEGHGFSNPENRTELYMKVLEFLSANL